MERVKMCVLQWKPNENKIREVHGLMKNMFLCCNNVMLPQKSCNLSASSCCRIF